MSVELSALGRILNRTAKIIVVNTPNLPMRFSNLIKTAPENRAITINAASSTMPLDIPISKTPSRIKFGIKTDIKVTKKSRKIINELIRYFFMISKFKNYYLNIIQLYSLAITANVLPYVAFKCIIWRVSGSFYLLDSHSI